MKLFQQPDLGFCQHCWQRCYQLLLVIVLACTTGAAQSGAPKAVFASQGMVASAEALASQVGVDILKAGGNAVDSAVAVGFALAVTFPQAGNLGGGGFMLLRMAAAESSIAIDYREKAPLAATSKMFLDRAGTVDKKRARFSHLSVGVPGTVAGLLLAQKRYGRLPRGGLGACNCFGRKRLSNASSFDRKLRAPP
jgi:gamma-glutamyltranspeptidase